MDSLNDDCLLLIFERFDLNARASLRLVSKRFRCLCDSIKIKKLVIFENNIPLSGELEHSEKEFGLLDTVYVFDLKKFFNSPILIDQMVSIRTLVVFGEDCTVLDFKSKFDHLVHLELRNLHFVELNILESPKLQHLVLKDVDFEDKNLKLSDDDEIVKLFGSKEKLSVSVYLTGFNKLASRQIKFLSIDKRADANFLVYCIENGLFDSIEHLRTGLAELSSLQYLSDQCSALLRIDVMEKPKHLIKQIGESDPEQLAAGLRADLTVFLLGLPFNQTTVASIGALLKELLPMITSSTSNSDRAIMLDKAGIALLKTLERQHDLKEFYKVFDLILIHVQPKQDLKFMKKFSYCRGFVTGFDTDFDFASFKQFLGIFPKLKTIEFASSFRFKYSAKLTDLIARQKQITGLIIEIPNEISLEFLLEFPRLKFLQLNSALPIDQSVVIKLFEASVHLYVVDLLFIKPADLHKEQLSSFKKLVNDRFRARFKARALVFRIEIHSRKYDKFVRYALGDESDPAGNFDKGQKNRMFSMIDYKHRTTRCCSCHIPLTPSTSYPRPH